MLSLETGGMENGVVNILNNINENVYENYVCCIDRVGELAERLRPGSVTIDNLSRKAGFSVRTIFRLARLLKEYQIDILHTHGWGTLVYGFIAARKAGTPVIIHGEHGTFKLDRARRRFIYKIIVGRVAQVLTVSDSLKRDLINIIDMPELSIRRIINGVNTDRFCPGASETVKKEIGLQGADRVIGSVGRLEKVKNYELMIRCFSEIKDSGVMGLLVGEGSQRADLERLANDLGIEGEFVFTGGRNDIDELMPLFDIFVCSSHSEGLSNTILEAMACGVPVVATDVGGNSEIIRHGETGLLVPAGDAGAMKDAVTGLLQNSSMLQQMKQRSREVAVEKYSISHMVSEYEDVYMTALNKKGVKWS